MQQEKIAMRPRVISIIISALVLLAIICEVAINDSFLNMSLYWPFYGYPLLVAMFLSVCSDKPRSQWILAAGSVLYGIWYCVSVGGSFFKYNDDLHHETSYMAGILNQQNYVFIGLYALPVLLAFWITTGFWERKKRPGFYR